MKFFALISVYNLMLAINFSGIFIFYFFSFFFYFYFIFRLFRGVGQEQINFLIAHQGISSPASRNYFEIGCEMICNNSKATRAQRHNRPGNKVLNKSLKLKQISILFNESIQNRHCQCREYELNLARQLAKNPRLFCWVLGAWWKFGKARNDIDTIFQ